MLSEVWEKSHTDRVDSLSLARWFIRTFAKWDEIYFAFDFAREAGDRFTETRFDFSIISFSLSRWRWTDTGRLFGSRQNKLDIFSRDGWRTVVSRDFASLNFGFGRVSGAKNGCWRFHEEKWLKICEKIFLGKVPFVRDEREFSNYAENWYFPLKLTWNLKIHWTRFVVRLDTLVIRL